MNKYRDNINKYYLDRLLKDKQVFYQIVNGIGYLSDGVSLSILKYEDIFIDYHSTNTKAHIYDFIKNINDNGYEKINGLLKRKDKIIQLESDTYKVFISDKYYNMYKKCDFYINGSTVNKPILIYDNEILVGFVLPIKEY